MRIELRRSNNDSQANIIINRTFVILLIGFFIAVSFMPIATAGGQDATFDTIDITVTPPVQGIGGEIKISVTANFFGGCCYYLYAYDVNPELIVPEEVQIISSLPEPVKSINAEPGGKATTVKFQWTVTGSLPGTFDLEIFIRTSNCGIKSEIFQVEIVEGASISPPTIFPKKPSVNEAITFSTIVRSGSDFIDIENTKIFIWKSSKDYSLDTLVADINQIFKINDNKNNVINQSDNTDDLDMTLIGIGIEYVMEQVQFSETWRAHLIEFDDEEIVYYWFNVETSDGKNMTSNVYKQSVEDLDKKYQLLDTTLWGTFFIVSLGVIFIITISWKYINRPAKGVDKAGIFILGSEYFLNPSIGKRTNIEKVSIARIRAILIIFIIILLVVFIAVSIYLGLFQDLISETGG